LGCPRYAAAVRRILFALLLSGCTSSLPSFAPPTGETVTVFVHGYKGSFLETDDAEHARAWLRVGQVMSAGDQNLALPWEGQRVEPSFPKLVAAGPLTKLTAVPLIVSADIYLSWLEFGRDELPGFIPFAYDWRQDVLSSGRALCDFLRALPAKKIQLVAHSMGGLVTWSCLSQDAEVAARVTKLVFAGTPFRGGPGMFDDLFLGTATGLNHALLSRDALFSFPSAWQLLSARSDFFVDKAGNPVELDAFDAENWVNRRWGVFDRPTTPADRAQLDRVLAAHAALHAQLGKPLLSQPKVMVIVGLGRATVSGMRLSGDGFDFKDNPTADGDGSVLVSSATPDLPFTRVETQTEHVALLNDPGVQTTVSAFLH
jgi:pimeloyl-ACP methyl ester carboxylesterase